MLRAANPKLGGLSQVSVLSSNGKWVRIQCADGNQLFIPRRHIGMFVARFVRSIAKIRYLILGGAAAGGVSLSQTYQSWKESLPNMEWVNKFLPSPEKIDSWQGSMREMKQKIQDFELNPEIKEKGLNRLSEFKDWFDKRLENAIRATEESELQESSDAAAILRRFTAVAEAHSKASASVHGDKVESLYSRVENLQDELIRVQLKYQKELEKLEKENKNLRMQLLLKGKDVQVERKVKRSLIDMYSDVLDELNEFGSTYKTADHLPRVVVVGDQSSGKTSVLEMIAKARIFPRGSGEMMTRCPINVTLSEGPYHIAQFKDSSREFDLTKESELAELRREVELRMMNSVRQSGKTVSNHVVSMTVKGPGLSRMVLVDLPGVISTQTVDMASDTRESIIEMSRQYMSNPNAIILCIQDGSVDAERSNVTDLVSNMDPQGKRTIFVLTKIDLAEENMAKPDRISKILSGKLFPMKALGYFGVVTGRGNKNESIDDIKNYEEAFFRTSKLLKTGKINTTQVTTKNMSLAVSECFWKMVRETVEQQADSFKAVRFNLETEWKNDYPKLRVLDREELFEKARGEILDQVANLSQVSAKDWEETISNKIWSNIGVHVFENILLPAANSGSPNSFNTTVDIRLKEWVELLPNTCVEIGWSVLKDKFCSFLETDKSNKNHDPVFDNLISSVAEEAFRRHEWEERAASVLRVIQFHALEYRSIGDKYQWDGAVKFLEEFTKSKLKAIDESIYHMVGPSTIEKWLKWKYSSEEEQTMMAVKSEIDLLAKAYEHSPILSNEEVTVIKNHLEAKGYNVDEECVKKMWSPIYRKIFLENSLSRTHECKKGFYLYSKGLVEVMDCHQVVLFWRIHQMLNVTANALRQQIVNREAVRLENEIKKVLDDFSQDKEKISELLAGRRVELAEALKKVRHVQEKLEEFINALAKVTAKS